MASKTNGQVINDLSPGKFETLQKVQPSGALQIRKGAKGAVSFFWRYSVGTSSERVLIGLYDPASPPKSLMPRSEGYSVAAAARAAEALALEHCRHRATGGHRALVAAKHEAAQAVAASTRRAESTTLEHLLTEYCDHLETIGRRSHRDARSIFRLHVVEAWPDVAKLPAKEVTGEMVADMMRKLIEAGKGRTANKLRSYCRAAYQTAKAAKSRPSIPLSFKRFEIAANPVAETEPDESQNRAAKHPLTSTELATYWRVIERKDGFKGALLRLHFLTGGQRIEQLVNLRTVDVQNNLIVLHDGKGRPGRPPRAHTVPLLREAKKALAECDPTGQFALSTDGGITHVAATTLSDWAVETVGLAVADFQAKRLRSGIETLLASIGVSQDVRGRLQSHGIGGVQSRHYDGHDYLGDKLKALEVLFGFVTGTLGNGHNHVRPTKSRRTAKRQSSEPTTNSDQARR